MGWRYLQETTKRFKPKGAKNRSTVQIDKKGLSSHICKNKWYDHFSREGIKIKTNSFLSFYKFK